MPSFDIVKHSELKDSYRVQSVIGAFDLDTDKLDEHFAGNIDIEGKDWNVGLIVGGSGTGTIWSTTTTPAQYHAQVKSPYWKLIRYGHATRNHGGMRGDMVERMMKSTSRQRITYSFIYVGEEGKERLR